MAIDKVKLNRLHRESQALLEALADRLPADDLKQLRTFSMVGEWGLLVDSMSACLVMDQIAITPEERDALAEIFAIFPLADDEYPYWRDSEQTLAALNVVGSR